MRNTYNRNVAELAHCIIVRRSQGVTQSAFIFSKLTIETLEQSVNMFRVNNKDTRTTPYTGVRHLFCRCTNFSLAFIFFRTVEAIDSPLYLSQPGNQGIYCAVLLNGITRKGYINFPQTSHLWKENGFSFIFSKMNWQLILYEPLASWWKLFCRIISVFLTSSSSCW